MLKFTVLFIGFMTLLIFLYPSYLIAAEEYLDIDLIDVTIPEIRGLDPSPFHLSYDSDLEQHFITIMTLDHLNGAQMGDRLRLAIPPDPHTPAAILWSKHFLPTITRGLEPMPFIVYRDYTIYHFPLAHDPDGTPLMAGDWETISLTFPGMYGDATCMTEMPGSEFSNGLPRLFIGTQDGFIIVLMYDPGVGAMLDEVFATSDEPILALEPIPQYGYIALGVLSSNSIRGISLSPPKGQDGDRQATMFRLIDPRTLPITDFDVFGPQDEQLTDPETTVRLILANGTGELALTSILATQGGFITELELMLDARNLNIQKIAPGSLLMLPSDGSTVTYDPHYSSETGSSECESHLIGVPPEPCHLICGDVDNDGLVNILDIVYLINYKYKEGPAPYILRLGDADGIDPINILDIVYLINYKYKEGPNPACP